jgi:prepilin-type N-terminal cleavage/methylation domain-containing protein
VPVKLHHRGFTLVEVLISLVLTGLVLGLLYDLLTTQQRTASGQAQRAAVEATLRASIRLLGYELSEASAAADPDFLSIAPESVTYRAMRGTGVACEVTASSVAILLGSYHSFRQPQAGRDSVLLYAGPDPLGVRVGEWVALPVAGVASSQCQGASALHLTTVVDTGLVHLGALALPAPLRLFEIMQLKLYLAQGSYWLGARSVSAGEVIQPALGPFAVHGLELAFFDSLVGSTRTPGAVRSGRVQLRALSSVSVRNGSGASAPFLDSAQVALPLRNAEP